MKINKIIKYNVKENLKNNPKEFTVSMLKFQQRNSITDYYNIY